MIKKTMDGNFAVSEMMHKITEFASIYPITPSSPMAEEYEHKSSDGETNLFGTVPKCVEMQSEAGVAGALHGALLSGAISTTFTSSQGLLLMIPNMYKIAGELLPCVINVSARSLATHALNIFGDHSDVMATRETGFAMLCASNVQECYDFALLSLIASFNSSIPFLHFFDGFRTSHEIAKIDLMADDEIKSLLPYEKIEEFKQRALNPSNPKAVGTNQNADVFFQNREASNLNYASVASNLKNAFNQFYNVTKRRYDLFDYVGNENAEFAIIAMGSGAENVEEFLFNQIENNYNNIALIKIRLFRPFDLNTFASKLPKSIKRVCVLDRVKEATANCDPLASEVIGALKLKKRENVEVVCGRYGLGGKDFTLGMVKAVCDNLVSKTPKNRFLIGINDDISHLSLDFNQILENGHYSALFYGLGSDGTVSANKNSIKIIGDNTQKCVQGYFEYDSKKSGSMTISHLRVSDDKILSHYLINNADLIAVHNYNFLHKIKISNKIKQNGTLLFNCKYDEDDLIKSLPLDCLQAIVNKKLKVYFINANQKAFELGLKNKINIIMQACFFKVSKQIDEQTAKNEMIKAIKSTYGSKGEQIVNANINAVNAGFDCLKELNFNKIIQYFNQFKEKVENAQNVESVENLSCKNDLISEKAENYVNNFVLPILSGGGNKLPVSAFEKTGATQTATTKFEKRKIADRLPKWISENCLQCNMCALSCPHGCLRATLIPNGENENGAENVDKVESVEFKRDKKYNYRMQLKPYDCTGCGVCANVCPAKKKALEMVDCDEIFEKEVECDKILNALPNKIDKNPLNKFTIAGSQFEPTLFEFSGACAGCGETPYIKLLAQLFGKNLIIANATGCSSIYGASCPTCPYAKDESGCGPVFANSLFEDNAEFGLGLYYGNRLRGKDDSVWIVGGDGWAYDIGFGGLDHILSSGENVNILVLDTEVYSNTGGQMSKSTPRGSSAKFASGGKARAKKRLSSIALCYGDVYVAQISLGANMQQAINAFKEASEYNGVSLIIAYCPCINHGIDMSKSSEEMKLAVQCGYFDLFRYNPNNKSNPLSIDSTVTKDYLDFTNNENRYKLTKRQNAVLGEEEIEQAKQDAQKFRNFLKCFATLNNENKDN